MADTSVQFWLNQAGKYNLLSAPEELILGGRIRKWWDWPEGKENAPRSVQRSGKRAYDKLFNCNLRMVVKVARKYSLHADKSGGLDFSDLLQMGAVGLMRGVEKFDPARGYKFSTFAYWWIRQGVSRNCQQVSAIRVPPTQVDILNRWRYRPEGMTIEQFAEQEGMPPDRLLKQLQITKRALEVRSIDKITSSSENGGSTLVDFIPASDTDPLDEIDMQLAIEALSEAFPDEVEALRMQAIDQANIMSIADAIGFVHPRKTRQWLLEARAKVQAGAEYIDADLLLTA